ncbi:MAG: chemotaxis protein CheA [Planctomycetaceae bacterium]|jgi:two-component system chemotaxis sensor kinase CheA|nr:chemotaxis protein CheA [Planctomycetaceae bacterium]
MDLSLIQEFVQEAREYIDEIEPTLIEISNGATEAGAVDSEMINAIFRLYHSMKGSAGFLSLTTIVSVTHEAETLLDKIRNGKAALTPHITATLCKAIDLFRVMLEHIEDTGNDEGFTDQATAIIAVLKKHVAGEPVTDNEANMTVPLGSGGAAPAADSDDLSFDELASEPVKKPIPSHELDFSETKETAETSNSAAAAESEPAPVIEETVPELADLQLSPEMRQGFVIEANEQIESAEQGLLAVVDGKTDPIESLKDTFRYIHSLKGNCGFMGLVHLEHLSHTMETLLDGLRNGEIKPEEKYIGKLLSLLDVLRDGVKDIDNGGNGNVANLNVYVQELNVLLGKVPAPAVPPKPAVEEDVDAEIAAAFAARDAAQKAAEAAASKPAAVSAPAVTPAAPPPASVPAVSAAAGGQAGATQQKAKQDIRVDLHKLDLLINLVGELVIAESMVTRCPAVANVEDEYYNRAKHQLRRICDDLQDCAMSVRMIPLSATFRKMIRLVHDLATKSGKKIKLNLLGEETEVDKTVIEQIADPLVHIVRNSCDHGIEPSEDRIKAGKSEQGEVTLEGKHEGGEVWITITDDGRGLNRDKIIAKALERGLAGPDIKDWPNERIFKLVFEPGFSTADKVTDISGRGVGMDVVKRNIEKLNGRIDINSQTGKGSTFTLRIPLTLAIVDAMLVRVGGGKYMIPTLVIRESLVPLRNQVTVTPEGREILRLREEMLPIVRLYDVFGCQPGATRLRDGILIVAEDGGRSFAFFVDEIIGQQQTVIKGLPDYIGEAHGFSGCTILGDGSVSLIVDVGAVSEMTGSFHADPADKAGNWGEKEQTAVAESQEGFSFADLEAEVTKITEQES